MSASRQRISARDYKGGGRRRGLDLGRYQQFGAGLAVGLVVALAVFVVDRRTLEPAAPVVPPRAALETAAEVPADAEDPAEQYDFYDMLPNFEVEAPKQQPDVRREQPSVPIEQPGAYLLQVGAFQNAADAERLRLKLSKLRIDATIQRIAVDADVRHRVRIGPIRDLQRLNATRRQLHAADIDSLLIRLPD